MNVVSKGRFVIRFKRGKLYRVIKDTLDPNCKGCVLRYMGIDGVNRHYSTPIKLSKRCQASNDWGICYRLEYAIREPDDFKLVEYESMIKFCKKLKEKLDAKKEKN